MPRKPPKPAIHPKDKRLILQFESQGLFRKWLAGNCNASEGIWIKFAKKGSGIKSVVYSEALDVALCFGWIDSQVMNLDERFYLQRFTPRGPRSRWSKINCGKVQKLIEQGEMAPRGLKEFESARKDGRWERAYDGQRHITVPPDFRKTLDQSVRAARAFAKLGRSVRYGILYRIRDAKRPETRRRRIDQFVKMLRTGESIF